MTSDAVIEWEIHDNLIPILRNYQNPFLRGIVRQPQLRAITVAYC